GIDLAEGQNLVGAGKAVKLTGSYSGYMVYFTPLPGEGTPTIIGDDDSASLITFQNNSSIVNLNLEGEFYHGVFGPDVESNFWIQDLVIDLDNADGNGVYVNVNNPRDNVYNLFTTSTPSGFINWNRIFDSSTYHGVKVNISAFDGGAHAFDLAVTENTITNVWYEAIHVDVDVDDPGTSLKNSIDISDNSIDNTGNDDGIYVYINVAGGGFLDQDDPVTINDNTINDVNGFDSEGIELTTTVTDAGSTAIQTIDISGNTITNVNDDVGGDGINVDFYAFDDGFIDQANTVTINNNSIDTVYDDGIDFDTRAFSGGTILQTASINYNTIDNTEQSNGIEVDIRSEDAGSSIVQTLSINGNTIEDIDSGAGIDVEIDVRNGGFLDQAYTININNNFIDNVDNDGGEGIDVDIEVYDPGSTAIQTININYNSINDIYRDGIEVEIDVENGAFLDQDNTINILGNTITDVGTSSTDGDGIDVNTNVYGDGSTAIQTVNIVGNSIDGTYANGIEVDTDVTYGAFLNQENTITINDNTILNIGNDSEGEGIYVSTYVRDIDSTAIQTININNNSIENIQENGIKVDNDVRNQGFLDQANTITISGNTIDNTRENDGIDVETYVYGEGTTAIQTINIDDNLIGVFGGTDNIDERGIEVENDVRNGGFLDQADTINIRGNTVTETYNDGGIYIGNDVDRATLLQTANVLGNVVGEAGGAVVVNGIGIKVDTQAYGDQTTVNQTINVNSNTVAGVEGDGVQINTNAQNSAVVDQASTISVNYNTITYADGDGIEIDNQADDGGTLLQTINVNNNSIAQVDGDGIYFENDSRGFSANGPDDPSTLQQTINIENNIINGNTVTTSAIGGDGIDIDNEADNYGVLDQANTINIRDNTILNVTDEGIEVDNDIDDYGTIRQTLNIIGNSVDGSGNDGIEIDGDVEDNSGTKLYQVGTISHNTLVNNGVDGLYIDLNVDDGAFSTQTFDIGHNSIAGNSSQGVKIDLRNDEDETSTSFFLDFYNNVIHDNSEDNVYIINKIDDDDASQVFNATFRDNSIVNNTSGDGIEIYFSVDRDGVLIADIDFIGNTVGGHDEDGINVKSHVEDAGRSTVTLEFTDNTVFLNGDDGIDLRNEWDGADTGGMAVMSATFGGNDINANDDDGVFLYNDGATGDLHASQTVLFIPGGNVIRNHDGAGDFGLYASNNDNGIQFVNLTSLTFINNDTNFDGNGGGTSQTIIGP
ncbi:MAG: hypothetical protein GY791_04510, partial [Alphaproteobacteria bacterium]|nr:hypothetical protein [Alphaproteobacteria bacterium]